MNLGMFNQVEFNQNVQYSAKGEWTHKIHGITPSKVNGIPVANIGKIMGV